MNPKFDIVLSCEGFLPEEIFSEFISEFSKTKIVVSLHKREPTVWAALEWAIPTAIVVYLAKPYFETLLQEAAKEHYPLLKQQLQKLAKKIKPMGYINSTELRENQKQRQSRVFSIRSILRSEIRATFLFNENSTIEQWELALNLAVESLKDHNESYPNDKLSIEISGLEKQNPHTVYFIFNEEKKNGKLLMNQKKEDCGLSKKI